jgi:putative DNA primase/helicase
MTKIIPNMYTVFANGQNLRVAEDMAARRTLRAGLDANVEDTTKRKFSQPSPTRKIAADRGQYVAAVLTIARAYIVAGMPKLDTLPSYDDWCRFVRSPLIWLGRDDPVETMREIRETDPVRTQRLRVFTEWKNTLGATNVQSKILPVDGYTIKDLIDKANRTPSLREVLLDVAAASRAPNEIDPRALGNWLRLAKDTRIGRLKLIQNKLTADKSRPRWLLVEG